jgi:hypothetical protein
VEISGQKDFICIRIFERDRTACGCGQAEGAAFQKAF